MEQDQLISEALIILHLGYRFLALDLTGQLLLRYILYPSAR